MDYLHNQISLHARKFIIAGTISIIVAAGLGGYWLGVRRHQLPSQSSQKSLPKQSQPSTIPTDVATPSPTFSATLPPVNKINYVMPTNGIILEACSSPWDYDAPTPSPGHVECLEFEANGTIQKKFHDAFSSSWIALSSNHQTLQEQKASISAELKTIYQELTNDKYVLWLKTPKAPIVGAIMPHIKLYSGDWAEQYTVTVYRWGADYSEEAQKIKEIFEHLQSFSSSLENKH